MRQVNSVQMSEVYLLTFDDQLTYELYFYTLAMKPTQSKS